MKEEGFLAMNNTEPLRMKGEINPLKIDEVEEIVERYEGATRKLGGFPALLITLVAIGSSVFSLYAAPTTIVTQMLRGVFVMLTLFLTVLAYPAVQKHRNRIPWFDWALAFLSILPVAYMLWDFEEFIYRMVTPTPLDMVMGLILIGLRRPGGDRPGFSALCLYGAIPSRALEPSGVQHRPDRRAHVHDAGGDLRRSD
jgi:hypothetical protein